MKKPIVALVLAAAAVLSSRLPAEEAAQQGSLARMPVKEITVFKDGHAFVLHTGSMATDAAGNVVMDYLPSPVLGTFWPAVSDKNAKLSAVVSGRRKVKITQTAMSIREMLEANIGSEVSVTEVHDKERVTYTGSIVGFPVRTGSELEAVLPPGSPEQLPQKSDILLLKGTDGTHAIPVSRIVTARFKDEMKNQASSEEFRNLMTLKLDWKGKPVQKSADVGMMYVQKGIRWIPNYKVVIDGEGSAVVELQATLINELTDLSDVTCNMVVGVPQFAFKDTADPIGLQAHVAQLSQHFREDSLGSQMFSNAIMSQVAMPSARMRDGAGGPPAIDLGPEVTGSQKAEDLFIYTVSHVSLKKGQRMVLPIRQFKLTYKDVYTLNIPFVPPVEVARNFSSQQQTEIARQLAAPKVAHKVRLTNKSDAPLTTGPALILKGDKVLSQGMITYTGIGGDCDLSMATAVDVNIKKTDREVKRVPNAANWQGAAYARADLEGTITLTSYSPKKVEVEVVRNVLGNIDKADNDGKITMLNVLEDPDAGRGTAGYPYWWGWYDWPSWWRHFNNVGQINWTVSIEPGKSVDLKYSWNYFWR